MKPSFFLFLSLIVISICAEEEEFPVENDITVLTNATFDKALEKYEHMLVMFYAPWCGHCKKFKPELEKASAVLRKENLFVAKVDATVEKKLDENINLYRDNVDKQEGYAAFVIENAYKNELETFIDMINGQDGTRHTFEEDYKILSMIDEIESR